MVSLRSRFRWLRIVVLGLEHGSGFALGFLVSHGSEPLGSCFRVWFRVAQALCFSGFASIRDCYWPRFRGSLGILLACRVSVFWVSLNWFSLVSRFDFRWFVLLGLGFYLARFRGFCLNGLRFLSLCIEVLVSWIGPGRGFWEALWLPSSGSSVVLVSLLWRSSWLLGSGFRMFVFLGFGFHTVGYASRGFAARAFCSRSGFAALWKPRVRSWGLGSSSLALVFLGFLAASGFLSSGFKFAAHMERAFSQPVFWDSNEFSAFLGYLETGFRTLGFRVAGVRLFMVPGFGISAGLGSGLGFRASRFRLTCPSLAALCSRFHHGSPLAAVLASRWLVSQCSGPALSPGSPRLGHWLAWFSVS
ncbi:hypothetical protein OIU85_013756 [Salix viminalis]|uniref:Uncharacterized protein n=1 Tax=Salix viminalis TaxID=40686 RepID=A0A9Q0NMB6_SALVM|nr:hypothetical protein OIU85_013756 [Salix viminalis]